MRYVVLLIHYYIAVGTFATKQYQPKTLIAGQAQKKSVILLIYYAYVAFLYVLYYIRYIKMKLGQAQARILALKDLRKTWLNIPDQLLLKSNWIPFHTDVSFESQVIPLII